MHSLRSSYTRSPNDTEYSNALKSWCATSRYWHFIIEHELHGCYLKLLVELPSGPQLFLFSLNSMSILSYLLHDSVSVVALSIGLSIHRETANLDALVAEAEEAVELLKEHRSALITAAVTGKIDVEEA